ncbi:MAG: SBBP repeat-containing protein [Bacteroidetes bacterium]|nr:SBBP repeat-containing protein [Bacteroidota bacterium]
MLKRKATKAAFNLIALVFTSITYASEPAIDKELARQWMQNQKVHFIENKGQMMDANGIPVPFVLFKVEAPGLDMYITDKGLSYLFIKQEEELEKEAEESKEIYYSRIDMILKGANIQKENVVKEYPSEADHNFFYGHCPDGIYGVKQYEKIAIRNVYPGIDWVLYNSNEKGFKYDFIVHPGADPKQIELIYSSLNPLTLNAGGKIEIKTDFGSLIENTPISFQNNSEITTHFIKTANEKNGNSGYDTHIRFGLSEYNTNEILRVDPQLAWGTHYGGTGLDSFTGVATDNTGNVFVTGYTLSPNFPTQSSGTAYYQGVYSASQNALILKFSNNGSLLWATFYGAGPCIVNGGGTDGHGITVDLFGNVYVVGREGCATFPTQNMAGAYFQAAAAVAQPFILKFDNTGNRLWATTFGGGLSFGGGQSGRCKYVTTDALGNMFICGYGLTGLPSVNPGGGAYTQAAAGGYDMFFAKFNVAGALVWSTYFGGSSDDYAIALTVDNGNNLFATGQTNSGNFPMLNPGGVAYFDNTYNGAGDATVIKFSNNGNLLWSTYFGGTGFERGYSIDCDLNGDIFFTGETVSANFPVQNPGAGAYFDNSFNGGTKDVFVSKFLNNYSLFWSTYYGGTNWEGMYPGNAISYEKMGIITDNCSNVYVTGVTTSTDFPTFNNSACNSYFFSGPFSGSGTFILKFSITGSRLWATLTPGGFGHDITVDRNDNLFVVGEHSGALFNPGGGAYFDSTPLMSDQGFVNKFSQPPPTFTQSQVNPGSCTCNGSATLNITSACSTPPYNYIWSNGSQTLNTSTATNTITGLCPGNYWVYITDAVCNRDTVYYTLTGSSGSPALSSIQTNVTCNGTCNGSSIITPAGGLSPYTYLWNNGQTTATATGLCTGSFSVVVTDANNCTAIRNISIGKAPLINLATSSPGTCTAGKGTATVVATNGIAPYTYLWNTGQTTPTATGMSQANYTVTVRDASGGCTQTKTVTITSSTITIAGSVYNDPCGMSNNAIPSVMGGGTAPYTYSWSSGQTTLVITGLSQGTYSLTVTDATGCTATSNVTFTNPPIGPTATFTQSPSGTVCKNTLVNFTHTGTTGTGVTFSWVISPLTPANVSGTTTDFSYTFISAGTYSVFHSVNRSGCSTSITSTVTVIDCAGGPTVTATGSSVCSGTCSNVTSAGSGGTGPYTYNWSNGSTTQNISPCPVSTTTYTVTITDSAGGTSTSTAVATVNPAVTATTVTTNISCSGGTGAATASGVSGSLPYTYSWSAGVQGSGFQVSGLTAGTYTVTITDSKGCTGTSTATIISPQPLAGQFTKGTANCAGCGCKEWVMVNAAGGTSPYSYSWPDGYVNRYKNQLCPGTHMVNITDKNGCAINVNLTTP